jgi:MFS family permease
MFGQAVGPVIGGVLSQYFGFRSIFYFLTAMSLIVIVFVCLLLPETQRKIAGDGSKPLYGIYRPFIQGFKKQQDPDAEMYAPPKISFSTVFDSFRILGERDVFVSMLYGGIIYTVWSMITSSTASLFKEEYNLNEVLIGLCFLPNGLGCVLGSFITGRVMDGDYKREMERYRQRKQIQDGIHIKQQTHPDFPIEKVRLRRTFLLTVVFAVATAVYGFSVEWIIFIPLTLQFLSKSVAILSLLQALINYVHEY